MEYKFEKLSQNTEKRGGKMTKENLKKKMVDIKDRVQRPTI